MFRDPLKTTYSLETFKLNYRILYLVYIILTIYNIRSTIKYNNVFHKTVPLQMVQQRILFISRWTFIGFPGHSTSYAICIIKVLDS